MKKIYIPLIIFILLIPFKELFGSTLSNENDSIKAAHLYYVARECYREGKYYEALDSFLVALELRKRFYGEENNILASTYMAIGNNYKNIGKNDLALQYMLIAEKMYIDRSGKDSKSVSNVYFNLGNIYRAKLNYPEALQYFEQSISILKNQDIVDDLRIAYIYYSVAEIYFKMKKYDIAIEIIENNISHSTVLDKLFYSELLGAIYQVKNDYYKASEAYQKAIEYTLESYRNPKSINLAIQYLNYASFLHNAGNYREAEDYLEKAYSIISITESETGSNLAKYYRINGFFNSQKEINTTNVNEFRNQKYQNYEKSIYYFKKALKAYNFPDEPKLFTNLDSVNTISIISSIELLKLIADTYVNAALIFEGNKNSIYKESLIESLKYYGVVSKLLQKTKKEISDDDSRIFLTELEQSTFIKLVQSSYRAYKLNDSIKYLETAFQNAELLKSGSLFDKLSNDEAMKASLIPDSLLNRENEINVDIANYQAQKNDAETNENADSEKIDRLNSKILDLKRERDNFYDDLEKNYSQYYNLKYSDNSVKIAEIQKKLSSEEVLIEYVLNQTDSTAELYTFFISPEEAQFDCKVLPISFSKNIDEVFQFMSSAGYMFTKNEDSKRFCIASNFLYKDLLGPYEHKIKDKKLLVIPDGKLSYISFDALLTELPDTSSTIYFNKLNYLIKNNSINYSYSANLIFGINHGKKSSKKEILAFAPNYISDSIYIGNKVFALRPLKGTLDEVEQIASEVKTNVFKENEATELNFREKCGEFDILHLAMHAYINDSLPSLSKFAFKQIKGGPPDADGLLSTADIYNLQLNARLAVLSACNTGTGQLRKGEGVISLARGFLYAGCPAIIMTLWEVEDNSGTKIMSSFYKYLKKGKNKDEALRLAKLEYLDNANSRLAHPHYWLGFVSIGDKSSLYRSYDFYFFALLLLTILGIIVEQILRIKKARKKRELK